ncbi:MAG: hypothetical protein ABR530_04645 [Pyrinomonadaceae bacterium]
MNKNLTFTEMRQRKRCQTGKCGKCSKSLFNSDWEVFVVKYDKTNARYTSRTACCAEGRVEI